MLFINIIIIIVITWNPLSLTTTIEYNQAEADER